MLYSIYLPINTVKISSKTNDIWSSLASKQPQRFVNSEKNVTSFAQRFVNSERT